jgi:hypothetical protein
MRSSHIPKITMLMICTVLLLGRAAHAKSACPDVPRDNTFNNEKTLPRTVPYKVFADDLCLPLILKNYCPLLYTDDFRNPDSGWPVSEGGNVQFAYTNGEYQISLSVPHEAAVATPGLKLADFIAEVDARYADPVGEGFVGFVFGLSNSQDEYYQVVFQRAGYYGIQRYNPSSPYWTDLANGTSSAIVGGTGTNHLGVERIGTNITLYINGVWVASVEDGTYTGSRNFGLVVTSFEWGNSAFFDNVVMHQTSCGSK